MKKLIYILLIVSFLLSVFAGCSEEKPQQSDDTTVTSETEETTADTTDAVTEETTAETTDVVTGETTDVIVDEDPKPINPFFPEEFVYPYADGSTSTINLEKAIKQAIFGDELTVFHSRTYQAFNNFINSHCLLFTAPLSKDQIQQLEEKGIEYVAEPIAGEGFVFVVNKNNPVDTLTIEQIKGIYSGKITNWSQVGGNDAEIVAYQRNADSGSQNYMIAFMGDTELMPPTKDTLSGSMGQILDVVANYDNGINAIGYSVYAYSDGMYENISEIKYIKVNGVEPSIKTLEDGTYPLLGYSYAIFRATEPEDSDTRLLVKWIQSDEGQQVVANAGYVPYRKVEGLTLPDPTSKKLYIAEASSGIPRPELEADYYYRGFLDEEYYYTAEEIPHDCDMFLSETLNIKVSEFIKNAAAELSKYDEEKLLSYLKSLDQIYESMFGYDMGFYYDDEYEHYNSSIKRFYVRKTLENGYLSVLVAIRYIDGTQESERYYYDVRTAVFDIYTEEQLELSDLFFDGVNFVPILNNYLAAESLVPYSGFGSTYEMKRDFSGLCADDFAFTADSIIFGKNSDFVCDGVELSLDGLGEYMVTSVPRDMEGYLKETTPRYKIIKNGGDRLAKERDDAIEIWYLKKGNPFISDELCDKINAFADNLYDSYFVQEKLEQKAEKDGYNAQNVGIHAPGPSFDIAVIGRRYIEVSGYNLGYSFEDKEYFYVIDGVDQNYFYYYFDAKTGEELKLDNDALFLPGWEDAAEFYYREGFDSNNAETWVEYKKSFDIGKCTVTLINRYESPTYYYEYEEGLKKPVSIDVKTEDDDRVRILVPREFIR